MHLMHRSQQSASSLSRTGLLQVLVLFVALFALLVALLSSQPPRPQLITPHNVAQLVEVARFQNDDTDHAFRQVALSPAGDSLFVTSGYNNYLWNLADGTEQVMRLEDAGGYTERILFADTRPVVVFVSWTNTMMFLDMVDGQPFQRIENLGHIPHGWNLSADGRLMTKSWAHTLTVFDVETGRRNFEITAPSGRAFHYSIPTFNADGRLLATSFRNWECLCEDDTGKDEIALWDSSTGEQVAMLGRFTDGVIWSFDFSDDDKLLAVGGGSWLENEKSGLIQLWDLTTGTRLLHSLTGGLSIQQVLISPDSRALAAQGYGVIWLWNIDDAVAGKPPLVYLNSGEHNINYYGIAFSPDGKLFATGSPGGDTLVYDTASGQLIATLPGHRGQVKDVAFSPDGRSLASIDRYDAIVWSLSKPLVTPTSIDGAPLTTQPMLPLIFTPTPATSG